MIRYCRIGFALFSRSAICEVQAVRCFSKSSNLATQTVVALVTGSSKGIGYGIVRELCKQFKGDVYLTARDVSRGKLAVAKLEAMGLRPKFHQLDIDDSASVNKLRDFLVKQYGGLDVLVNNAAIAYKQDLKTSVGLPFKDLPSVPFVEQAENTLKTNYWSTMNLCQSLFPILRSHARVVNMSSVVGKMAFSRCNPTVQKELRACQSIDDVNRHMKAYLESVKAENYRESGWSQFVYGVSKLALNLATPALQKTIDEDRSRSDIIINACCPGDVKTDMTGLFGRKTIAEGADTPVYLALLPPNVDSPRGQFVKDRKVIPWL